MMQQAASIEAFIEAPIGKWVAGKSFAMWVHSPTLGGSVYFGRPAEEDFPLLMQLAPLPLSPHFAEKFDAVVDASGLEGLTPAAFELLMKHLGEVGPFVERVRKVAIVRPGNMTGATLGGLFYELVQTRFRAALFTDSIEAYHWLKRPSGVGEQREVAEALATALGAPPILRQLRDWLSANLEEPSVGTAAKALKLSPRSLQRYLKDAGTQFRNEIDRARVRAAEALLLDGEDKLEAIARQVGCASLSHFSTLFRRTTGETPSDFRSRRK
jgi:AraC-like DNA-binding protein